jgi:hypothetical protein
MMFPRTTMAVLLCAASASPAAAQDTPDALPLAQNAPKPIYTPDVMLQRIASGQNAALGYWMAFAQMKEPPSGVVGPDVIDANAAALRTLARASLGGVCDWGIDYELGPSAPIAHLPKARALASVNSAAAVRAMSRGQTEQAVDQWLVGMRFSQHIESGGTLISTLTAWSALRSTWEGIEPFIAERRLTAAQRARLAEAIRAMPESVFNWSGAVLNEARVLQSPAALAATKPGSGVYTPPTAADTKRFLREVERVADALSRSPEHAAVVIANYQAEGDIHRFYRESMPSLTRVNENRREVKAARERMLAALK